MSDDQFTPNPEPADDRWADYALPEEGVADLADRLVEFLPEQDENDPPLIIGQVLDDFIDQSGAMPENLRDEDAHERISQMQMAVTLAYQLGRLESRSPDMVRRFMLEAIEKWEAKPLNDSLDFVEADFRKPKELVLPRLRRWWQENIAAEDYYWDEE
jgi:hypothetical protein